MSANITTKRTARACERCRHTRRRCAPPFPCQACVAAGEPCEVRDKARPHRQRRTPSESSPAGKSSAKSSVEIERTNAGSAHERPEGRSALFEAPRGQMFELLKILVYDVLKKQYEPSTGSADSANQSAPLLKPGDRSPAWPLLPSQTWALLKSCVEFLSWQDAKFFSIEYLQATIDMHNIELQNIHLSGIPTTHTLPFDAVALVFAAFSLGAAHEGLFENARFYFDISIRMVEHHAGQATLDLCLTYLMQHMSALRMGTSNYAQGIITRAVEVAHDLHLQHGRQGVQGLQLYMLIYMADQYCSMTYNTEPLIRSDTLGTKAFDPLQQADPDLSRLISLVVINGFLIDHYYRFPSPSPEQILELEAKIGEISARASDFGPNRAAATSFRTAYEPLGRVHMMCCRLQLRVPGLFDKTTWLSSICICVHAAEGILATYLELYSSPLRALAKRNSPQSMQVDIVLAPVTSRLGPTWRQVQRITISILVVIYAYWHGEMTADQASRNIALARLLLEYPRFRWREKLDEVVKLVWDVSQLGGFRLYNHMEQLLPGAGAPFFQAVCADPASGSMQHDQHIPTSMGGQQVFAPNNAWCGLFSANPFDGMLGFDLDSFTLQEPGSWTLPETLWEDPGSLT